MRLTAEELARVEAMMDRGQVYSEPAILSGTDRMLDQLRARARNAPAPVVRAPRPRPPAAASRYSNWLDLPSLEELIEARRALLRQ